MDIGVDQKCLGALDATALTDRILEQPRAAWMEEELRQQTYEVHRDTESMVMLFCDEGWPDDGELYEGTSYERLADVALPVINEIIGAWYEPGGVVLRAMAANLKAGGRINAHTDSLKSFHMGHRIHVPITTNAAVRYTISGKPYQFAVGNAYEINNQRKHSVMNLGREDRISFIFDYVPPGQLPDSSQ